MRLLVSVSLIALVGRAALAQSGPAPHTQDLSLAQAVALAKTNNPTYLGTVTGRRTADAAVRAAYGAFLPQVTSSFSAGYQQAGSQVFQGLTFTGSSNAVTSYYDIGLSYSLSWDSFIEPKVQKANQAATEANITGQAETLRATVTSDYVNALAAQANSALQDTLVATAQGQLDLAKAKMAVGQGTILDVNSAEVSLGQAQIAALTAHNSSAVALTTLFQQIGLPQPDSVHLTTSFTTQLPTFTLDSLLDLAQGRNPNLRALRASERAAAVGVRAAQSRYTPSLHLSTGWGGNTYQYTNSNFVVGEAQASLANAYANCQMADSIRTRVGLAGYPCGSPTLSAAEIQSIRNGNNTFPFGFTHAPLSLTASLSLPIFDGFSREQGLEQAIASKENAQYQLRAQELQTRTAVTQAYLNLQLAYKTIALRETNAEAARQQYQYAEDRYRVGQATYLDVTTARGTYVQAEVDRLSSIYDFQSAFAALEGAVGRPLR